MLGSCAFWISNLFDIGDVTTKCILICWINICCSDLFHGIVAKVT